MYSMNIKKLLVIAVIMTINTCFVNAAGMTVKIFVDESTIRLDGPTDDYGDIEDTPNPRRTPNYTYRQCGTQIDKNNFEIYFDDDYTDVAIEITDEDGYLIGVYEAESVNAGDTVLVTTTSAGATLILIFSGEDVIFETELE